MDGGRPGAVAQATVAETRRTVGVGAETCGVPRAEPRQRWPKAEELADSVSQGTVNDVASTPTGLDESRSRGVCPGRVEIGSGFASVEIDFGFVTVDCWTAPADLCSMIETENADDQTIHFGFDSHADDQTIDFGFDSHADVDWHLCAVVSIETTNDPLDCRVDTSNVFVTVYVMTLIGTVE